MEAVAVVTILALIQYFVFGYQVGVMRGKHGVKAPAITGAPEFERMFRVQQNTLEQLVMFVPAIWIYAYFGNPLWAAAIGLVFIVGRFIYKRSYVADASKRSTGFTISVVAVSVLLVAGLFAAGKDLYRRGSGPAVVIAHEIPGITPEVARFARMVADDGFSVYLPHRFGTPSKPL